MAVADGDETPSSEASAPVVTGDPRYVRSKIAFR